MKLHVWKIVIHRVALPAIHHALGVQKVQNALIVVLLAGVHLQEVTAPTVQAAARHLVLAHVRMVANLPAQILAKAIAWKLVKEHVQKLARMHVQRLVLLHAKDLQQENQ